MTDARSLARRLAEIGDGPPVLTLALDTHWKDEQQRTRIRVFCRDKLREARRLFGDNLSTVGLDETLARVESWVDDVVNLHREPKAKGLVLYASEGRGLFLECALPVSPETEAWLDLRPRLWPLVTAFDALEPAFIVRIDAQGAEFIQIREGVSSEEWIGGDQVKRHKQGGWAQANYQRHINDQVFHVWKECAAQLDRLAAESPNAQIVLLGQDANVRGFQRLLAPLTAKRVVGMGPDSPDRMRRLETAEELLDEARVASTFATVHHVLRQGLSDRSGTVGIEDTLMAANQRRLNTVVLSRRFDARGLLCASCGGLWTNGATGCVFCGNPVRTVSLREELARRCVAEGARLLIVPDGGPMDAYRGIGALLRHLTGNEHQRLGYASPRPAVGSTIEAP